MKLLHIISSLEMGGAQAVLYDLVTHLQKKEYDQTILYMHDGPYRERFQSAGIAIKQVRGVVSVFDPVCFVRLILLMREMRPDCVHTVLWAANWLGRLAARLLAIPCIASLHNNYDQNGMVRMLLDKMIPYRNRAIIAVSDEVKRSFCHVYPRAHLAVIPNGIDVTAVHDRARAQQITREQLGLSQEDFVMGTVGRFHPIKRYPLLLDTFALVHAQYPHARLILIGEGEQEQYLRAYAKKLGIAPFVKWVVGQQAYGYYRLFNCFVLASEKEGISIALLEAMSLGIVPMVTYHVAQHPVIENGRNGHVAKGVNATRFALRIGSCLMNGEHSRKMALHAQQTVRERFAITSMIAAYNRAFHTHTYMKN